MKLKPRPALYFLIPFLFGIITGEWTSIPILWLWLFILVCFVGSILTRNKTRFLCYLLIHIAIFTCGMLRFEIASVPKIPNHYFDQPVSFKGETVYQPERGKEWDACVAVGQVHLLSDPAQKVSAKLLIRFDKLMPLRYGKQITLTGDLQQAQAQRNPGGFNYRAYLERQNVSGILYHQGVMRIGKQSGIPPLRWMETLRLRTEQVIDDAYAGLNTQPTNISGLETTPSNGTTLHAKLLKGILLGKRGDVPSETLDIFRNSGTFHVLAVSGLHVGLIALFCYLALSAFRRIPSKVVSLLTIIVVLIYASLVGFRPSVFRASLMAILYLIATIIDRDADIYNLLAVAALALLLLNPMQLWDVGFQLSFVAVVSIVYFVPKIEKTLQQFWNSTESTHASILHKYKNKALKWLVLSYLVTFAAQIGTTPLIAYHFYRAYPIGILVGPFAVGLVSLIVGIGIVSVCIGFIWLPLAKILALFNHALFFIFLELISLFGQKWSVMKVTPPTFGLFLIYITFCICITYWKYLFKHWRMTSLIGLSILTVWVWDSAYLEKGRLLEVTTLDVAQGDAAIIKFPDRKMMLIDGGIQQTYFDEKKLRQINYDVGERIVEPYLLVNGIRELDLVVLSHPDLDHGGGLAYILKNFKVKQLIGIPDMELNSPTHQRLRNIAITHNIPYDFPYKAEIELTPTAKLMLLHPIDSASTDLLDENKNDDSLVFRLSYGEVDILFTGDIETNGEIRLIESQQDLRSEILKVPHHGSRTSSSAKFIDSVQPQYAIYSLGKDNRYNFPHVDVVKRYQERKCVQLRTDNLGAITLITDGTRCWFDYNVPRDYR